MPTMIPAWRSSHATFSETSTSVCTLNIRNYSAWLNLVRVGSSRCCLPGVEAIWIGNIHCLELGAVHCLVVVERDPLRQWEEEKQDGEPENIGNSKSARNKGSDVEFVPHRSACKSTCSTTGIICSTWDDRTAGDGGLLFVSGNHDPVSLMLLK